MKNLLFLLLPLAALAQQKVPLNWDYSLRDGSKQYGTIELIDQRADKSPGIYAADNMTYEFDFSKDPNTAIKTKFDADNKTKGSRNMVLLLDELTFFTNQNGKKSFPDTRIRAATFERKGDQYYFISSINKTPGTVETQSMKTTKWLPYLIEQDLTALVKTSYTKTPSSQGITADALPHYVSILSSSLPAFVNAALKDGVYDSANAFFSQQPMAGYTLERNDDGKVVRARNGSEKLSYGKIYAYVEGGKAYKNTFSGFMPLQRDQNGYYLVSNRGELEPVASNNTFGMFGLIGGVAGAIEQNARQNKDKAKDKVNVYMDPFTGEYIF